MKISKKKKTKLKTQGGKNPLYTVHTFIWPLSLFHSVGKGRQKQVMENEFW